MSASMDVQKLFDVRDVVAVVTGGGTGKSGRFTIINRTTYLQVLGIGLMIATALENNGALVFIVGRRKTVLEQAAAENGVRVLVLVQISASN